MQREKIFIDDSRFEMWEARKTAAIKMEWMNKGQLKRKKDAVI